ncbi:UDP-glycosyltransferase 73C6 [Hordeum vulgare]|nr:UDP-glycosyltransferase 73C6 [Hordeum vulgare]
MTTPTGGVAPTPSRAAAALSKLPNAAGSKKGKTSAKKEAADGSGSSKAKKKLAGRRTGASSIEAPASSLVEPAADAHHYNIAQHFFKEETRTTKKGKIKKGKIFTLPHCYEVLKDDEKWKKREDLDDLHLSNKRKRTIELNDDEEEDDASSDDGKRSPAPNSISYSKPKRPDGCKKDKTEKKKRKGDDELTNAMEGIVKARKEANEVRKMARNQDAAAEERRVAVEERKVALEERNTTPRHCFPDRQFNRVELLMA